jgi:hypothetical protein
VPSCSCQPARPASPTRGADSLGVSSPASVSRSAALVGGGEEREEECTEVEEHVGSHEVKTHSACGPLLLPLRGYGRREGCQCQRGEAGAGAGMKDKTGVVAVRAEEALSHPFCPGSMCREQRWQWVQTYWVLPNHTHTHQIKFYPHPYPHPLAGTKTHPYPCPHGYLYPTGNPHPMSTHYES